MRWFSFDSLVDFLGDIAIKDFLELPDLLLRFPSHWTSGSTVDHQRLLLFFLKEIISNRQFFVFIDVLNSKSFSFKIVFNDLLNTFWNIASKISIAQGAWLNTILKEEDFDCQVGTSMKTKSWRLAIVDCWWFSWERRGGVVDPKVEWDGNRRRRSRSSRSSPRRVCAYIQNKIAKKKRNFHQNSLKIKKCPL